MKTITKSIMASLACFLILISANSYAGNPANTAKNEITNDSSSHKTTFCLLFGAVLTQTNEKCFGQANGFVIVAPIPGTGTKPYTYTWSPTVTNFSADTADAAFGLAAGSYTVTITDSNGCSTNVTVNITQPPPITATNTAQVNNLCNGGTSGSVVVNATGGTPFKAPPPYRYAWNPNVSTTDSGKNLAAGTYIITITDTNRCTGKDTVTITQPAPMIITSKITSSSCSGSNGTATVMVDSGGTSPYSYFWSTGATTDTIMGLAVGSYTCNILDSNFCIDSIAVIVTDSTTLAVSLINSANEKCYGNSVGLADYTVKGGKGPDTYSWAPSGGTNTIASGLTAGTYTFTAIDSVGCQAIGTVTITQPAMITDSMTNVRNVPCFGGANGRVTVGVNGGTSPYTYTWSTGATTSNITGAAGTYSVLVTDANGCMDSASVNLTQPATAVADSNMVVNLTCYDGNNGSAYVTAYGGTHPYTYAWSAGGSTTDSATGLAAGTYIVTIRDSNRCRLRDTITVTQPLSFIVANDTTMNSNPCGSAAWVKLLGSMSKYTFSWSSGQTTDTATSLCNGTYYVSITDSTGCTVIDTLVINNPTGINAITYDPGVKVYPVPASSKLNISISDNTFALQTINVYDMTGRELMQQKVSGNVNLFTLDVSRLAEGTYFLKLTGNSVKIVKFSVEGK
jgi:hypothetical protein